MWAVFLLWVFEHWAPVGFPLPGFILVRILQRLVPTCEFRLKKHGGICFRHRVPSLFSISRNSLVDACGSGKSFDLFHTVLFQHKREETRLEEIELKYKKLFCQIPKVYREALKREKSKREADGDKPRTITPAYLVTFVEMYKGVWDDEIPTENEKTSCLEVAKSMIDLREKGQLLKDELERAWIKRFLLFDEHVVPYICTYKTKQTEQMQFYLSMPQDFRDLLEETGDKNFIARILRSLSGLSERKSSRLVRQALERNMSLSLHMADVLEFLRQPRSGKYMDWRHFW